MIVSAQDNLNARHASSFHENVPVANAFSSSTKHQEV
jgi:hypothetical protein